MKYEVVIPRTVQKQLDRLPRQTKQRIINRVAALQDDPRPPGCLKLKGYSDQYRIRVGTYRVRYQIIDEKLVIVLVRVAHRKEAYD